MSLTCYLLSNDNYNLSEAVNAVAGNICRCTGYHSIERAIDSVIGKLKSEKKSNIAKLLTEHNMLPEYFIDIDSALQYSCGFKPVIINFKLPTKYSILLLNGSINGYLQVLRNPIPFF